jgi:hypothetical protein
MSAAECGGWRRSNYTNLTMKLKLESEREFWLFAIAVFRKGSYRFLAVRTADNPAWIKFDSEAAITVK